MTLRNSYTASQACLFLRLASLSKFLLIHLEQQATTLTTNNLSVSDKQHFCLASTLQNRTNYRCLIIYKESYKFTSAFCTWHIARTSLSSFLFSFLCITFTFSGIPIIARIKQQHVHHCIKGIIGTLQTF